MVQCPRPPAKPPPSPPGWADALRPLAFPVPRWGPYRAQSSSGGVLGCWRPRERPKRRRWQWDGAVAAALPAPLCQHLHRDDGSLPRGVRLKANGKKKKKKRETKKKMFLNSSLLADPKQLVFYPEFFWGEDIKFRCFPGRVHRDLSLPGLGSLQHEGCFPQVGKPGAGWAPGTRPLSP